MAIMPQKQLLKWSEIEELGDLKRLKLVLDYLPDEELMRVLETKRGKGRNDYPVQGYMEFNNSRRRLSTYKY